MKNVWKKMLVLKSCVWNKSELLNNIEKIKQLCSWTKSEKLTPTFWLVSKNSYLKIFVSHQWIRNISFEFKINFCAVFSTVVIRNRQNEHLILVCQNMIGLLFKANIFGVYFFCFLCWNYILRTRSKALQL